MGNGQDTSGWGASQWASYMSQAAQVGGSGASVARVTETQVVMETPGAAAQHPESERYYGGRPVVGITPYVASDVETVYSRVETPGGIEFVGESRIGLDKELPSGLPSVGEAVEIERQAQHSWGLAQALAGLPGAGAEYYVSRGAAEQRIESQRLAWPGGVWEHLNLGGSVYPVVVTRIPSPQVGGGGGVVPEWFDPLALKAESEQAGGLGGYGGGLWAGAPYDPMRTSLSKPLVPGAYWMAGVVASGRERIGYGEAIRRLQLGKGVLQQDLVSGPVPLESEYARRREGFTYGKAMSMATMPLDTSIHEPIIQTPFGEARVPVRWIVGEAQALPFYALGGGIMARGFKLLGGHAAGSLVGRVAVGGIEKGLAVVGLYTVAKEGGTALEQGGYGRTASVVLRGMAFMGGYGAMRGAWGPQPISATYLGKPVGGEIMPSPSTGLSVGGRLSEVGRMFLHPRHTLSVLKTKIMGEASVPAIRQTGPGTLFGESLGYARGIEGFRYPGGRGVVETGRVEPVETELNFPVKAATYRFSGWFAEKSPAGGRIFAIDRPSPFPGRVWRQEFIEVQSIEEGGTAGLIGRKGYAPRHKLLGEETVLYEWGPGKRFTRFWGEERAGIIGRLANRILGKGEQTTDIDMSFKPAEGMIQLGLPSRYAPAKYGVTLGAIGGMQQEYGDEREGWNWTPPQLVLGPAKTEHGLVAIRDYPQRERMAPKTIVLPQVGIWGGLKDIIFPIQITEGWQRPEMGLVPLEIPWAGERVDVVTTPIETPIEMQIPLMFIPPYGPPRVIHRPREPGRPWMPETLGFAGFFGGGGGWRRGWRASSRPIEVYQPSILGILSGLGVGFGKKLYTGLEKRKQRGRK